MLASNQEPSIHQTFATLQRSIGSKTIYLPYLRAFRLFSSFLKTVVGDLGVEVVRPVGIAWIIVSLPAGRIRSYYRGELNTCGTFFRHVGAFIIHLQAFIFVAM